MNYHQFQTSLKLQTSQTFFLRTCKFTTAHKLIMARLALAMLCIAAFSTAEAQKSVAMTPTSFGLLMSSTAYEAVCWYEYLKKFPTTNTANFYHCSTLSQQKKKGALDLNKTEVNQKKAFSQMMEDDIKQLPSEYAAACAGDLASGSSETTANEGETIGDQGQKTYPFRAFAYCLMATLRGKYGDEATNAVKAEKSVNAPGLKHWSTVLFERDNEFRARHGVAPFIQTQGLTNAAQEWADENAQVCNSHHSDEKRKGEQGFNGESIADGNDVPGFPKSAQDAALEASNQWYDEIYNYPFAGGVDNANGGNGTIGHFTETVWKNTKYVGYGYAKNPNCPNKFFIVARYNPGGNYPGQFRDNILPPKF